MTRPVHASMPERFEIHRIAPQPWRNGAGLTREIAAAPAGSDGFDWRISVAEVTRDAPFSAFPGIDRCIVLLHGAGLLLRANHGSFEHRLDTPCVPHHFSGDLALHATLLGGPSSDFNVMVRRGLYRCEVTCHRGATVVPAAPVVLVLGCAGMCRVTQVGQGGQVEPPPALTLAADEALLWRVPTAAIAVHPLAPDARLLAVRLCHDHAP